ncbi:hypothetical protein MNEG_5246 [Monoraphidium neglectum]|uniref:Amine oxidase domain-containing protein n=1 Tax=Monoraphidium neglectum TaxID=145388 RepID=A0A0D2MI67_9CHLO|nr:hypothetical protein MNEG_5246 [Monoraphidium neglectum]KIZ02715.1 hypothetical protein MNEG_5246 [Monoraphidium neglectum]|eukprot:XP_013901734.1 hypothetical protein MNEG_5246 [Monoraphidium neglectum]
MQVESNIVQDYAADPAKLSLNWFDDDDEMAGGDSIVAQGYSAVVDYLVGVVKSKGGKIALGAPVTAITYNSGGVTLTLARPRTATFLALLAPQIGAEVTAGGTEYAAPFAIVTLPLGVLKAKTVKFTPKLPGAKANAIAKLGMGTLNKVVLQFPPASSWPDGNWFERMPLQSDKGRWREFFSLRTITRAAGAEQPIIVAFNAGSPAEYPASTSDAALVTAAVNTLRAMFGAANIPEPVQTWVTRWHSDPYSFGSYSSVQPGAKGRERADLAATTAGRLFWAGEATHQRVPATVQGAWLSGAAAAAAAAAAF